MDDDGFRNWGYYDYRGLNLQLGAERDTKSFIGGRDHTHMVGANGFHPRVGANGFHPRDCVVSEPPMHLDYTRDSWMTQRDRLFNQTLPGNPHYAVLSEPSGTHHMQLMPPADPPKEMRMGVEDPGMRKEGGTTRKRSSSVTATSKTPKPKKPKKGPSLPRENGNSSGHRLKPPKKSMDVVINGIDMDISHIPIPVCSCTGTPQPCYRWGCGGWQSACCTTTISIYPLPMSTKRRGARIAGRKMSQGAFKKVLEKLAAEGYNFDNPIDLRTHWAKHGTNKFVTIK